VYLGQYSDSDAEGNVSTIQGTKTTLATLQERFCKYVTAGRLDVCNCYNRLIK